MDLHPMEADLIQRIRSKYRFGEIMIECRDGLPVYIIREVIRQKLGDESK